MRISKTQISLMALSVTILISLGFKVNILNIVPQPFPDDGGTYVVEGKILLGQINAASTIPPISILPLSFLLLFLDPSSSLKIVALVYSTVFAVPFYFLAIAYRRLQQIRLDITLNWAMKINLGKG